MRASQIEYPDTSASESASRSWKVLLIGGHSGVGKTVVARELARRFGVALAEVDDFRLVLERMTTPDQRPALHTLLSVASQEESSPARFRDVLVEAAQTISYALEIVVANHVATDTPIILEGDGLLPSFAAQSTFAGLDVGASVRAVFLVEEDEARLLHNALQRGRGFETMGAKYQKDRIRASWLHGRWLRQEAVRYGLPVLSPQPWDTLAERVMRVI